MLLPIMAFFIYSRSQAAPEGRPVQEVIDALTALLRDIRQTVESRRLQAIVYARERHHPGLSDALARFFLQRNVRHKAVSAPKDEGAGAHG